MSSKQLNVGVIGYGMSAKVFHIPLIQVTPLFKLHAIVQRTPTASNSAEKDHPTIKIYPSIEKLLEDSAIDLVVITSTPEVHYAQTKAILEAGKHALVEKPFVPTSAEASSLIEIAAKHKKLICVYQNRRWDTDFLTFRKLQRDGAFGRIVEFETHYDRYKPERPETWKGQLGMEHAGGVIYDLGTHLLDQVYITFGMPHTVTGFFTNERNDEGEPDAFTAILNYGRGSPLVTAKASIMSIETEQLRFWVRGTEGSFTKFGVDIQEDQLKAGMRPGDQGFGMENGSTPGYFTKLNVGKAIKSPLPNVTPETYGALYSQFAKALEAGDESLVPVKASEARDVLKIIEAVRHSVKEGKTVKP